VGSASTGNRMPSPTASSMMAARPCRTIAVRSAWRRRSPRSAARRCRRGGAVRREPDRRSGGSGTLHSPRSRALLPHAPRRDPTPRQRSAHVLPPARQQEWVVMGIPGDRRDHPLRHCGLLCKRGRLRRVESATRRLGPQSARSSTSARGPSGYGLQAATPKVVDTRRGAARESRRRR
jgi:hypothetical protein